MRNFLVFTYPLQLVFDETSNSYRGIFHAWVYREIQNELLHRAAQKVFQRLFKVSKEDLKNTLFQKRLNQFLVDNLPNQRLFLDFKNERIPHLRLKEKTQANGHLFSEINLAQDIFIQTKLPLHQWHSFMLSPLRLYEEEEHFLGSCQFLDEDGLSIISDIDDTIRDSGVHRTRELVVRTFFEEFKPIEGMSALYKKWEQDQNAAFHYVSSMPWQFSDVVLDFFQKNEFPLGSLHFKQVRFKDRSALSLLTSPESQKIKKIQFLFENFPKRRFYLVGDTGEKDPEVYSYFLRKNAQRVERVYLRKVNCTASRENEIKALFKWLPQEKWFLFDDPKEIPKEIKE